MTTQMPDTVLYEEDEYYLLDPKFGQLFLRPVFGIQTTELGTGCWRGFRCTYEVDDGVFCLHSLEIAAEDGKYPLINGVPPTFPHGVSGDGTAHSAFYEGIGLRVEYTGTIHLCNRRDRTWIPDLFHSWMFFRVHEAVLEGGRVNSVTDISDKIAEVRAAQPESYTFAAECKRVIKMSSKPLRPTPKAKRKKRKKPK